MFRAFLLADGICPHVTESLLSILTPKTEVFKLENQQEEHRKKRLIGKLSVDDQTM